MSDKLCIDLCSGLGGFSQAFVDAGWEVITVDIEARFNPTICADITKLTAQEIESRTKLANFRAYQKVVVWASPPCERFSVATPYWPKKGIRKALDIVGATIELIIDIKPDYWMLENPRGRLRWFLNAPPNSIKLKDYGFKRGVSNSKPRRPTKPTDLWGNITFSFLPREVATELQIYNPPGHKNQMKRTAYNAEMPKEFSQTILEAVESQP